MEVIFRNKQPRILGTCTGRRILPGKHPHQLNQEELDQIISCDQFKAWQKLDWVQFYVGEEGAEEAGETDDAPENMLESVNLETAKSMIAACADEDLLRVWAERDKRKGVGVAVEMRLVELAPEEEEG